jgi:hypothetical protein
MDAAVDEGVNPVPSWPALCPGSGGGRGPGWGLRADVPSTGLLYRLALSVHDAGTIINPMIAEGQIHGGALRGLDRALCEELRYDEAGQCITATFMDYAIPTAEDAPPIEIAHFSSPSPLTPLGSKGLRESRL